MGTRPTYRNSPAFTLIELLTVIAIIALLIAMLVPALMNSRTQARRVLVAAKLRRIGISCTLFAEDLRRFPNSSYGNPFEVPPPPPPEPRERLHVQGAQVLFLELVGADTHGYVKPERSNDTNGDGIIDYKDWRNWYSGNSAAPRWGPYLQVADDEFTTPHQFMIDHPEADRPADNVLGQEDGGIGGSSKWNNGRLPFFIDDFGFPILYYSARPHAAQVVATGCRHSNDYVKGVFDQSNNAGITGFEKAQGGVCYERSFKGWFFGVGTKPRGQPIHPIAELGYEVGSPNLWPETGSFAWFVCSRAVFDAGRTGSGRLGNLQTYNSESFILISAGQDGRYGTPDDLQNFTRSQRR